MYRSQWLEARDVVLTVPQSGHVVAGGLLAAALCLDDTTTCERHLLRPAPLLLRAPLQGYGIVLRQWLSVTPRPRLWILGLDAAAVPQVADIADSAGLMAAGARILIGPNEHADPVERVCSYLRDHPQQWSRPLEDLGPLMEPAKIAQRKDRFKILINRGLNEEQTAIGEELTGWLDERVQPFALLPAQIRAMRDAWDAGNTFWAPYRRHFSMDPAEWYTGFLEGALVLDTRDDEARWQVKVQGFSTSAQRLRRQLGQAERLPQSTPCLFIAHDADEAWRLATELAQQRGINPPEMLQDAAGLPPGVWVVAPQDEVEVYTTASAGAAMVIDVPPLHERSMDVPHMAMAHLGRLHRLHQRPGVPRSVTQDPRHLQWLAHCHWPHGSADMHAYLAQRLRQDAAGDWSKADPGLPLIPAVGHPSLLSDAQASMDSLRAQMLRWALGAHSTQVNALASLGLNTSALPAWAWAPGFPRRNAPPRRLIWDNDQWTDRWRMQ